MEFKGGESVKIGIMADTHDHLNATEKAIGFFNGKGVEHVLHAGDLISPFTAGMFSDLEAEFHYVWGNNDGDHLHTNSKLEEIGADPGEEFKSLEIDGLKIALLHGTDRNIVDSLAKNEEFDLVVRGHTHEPEIQEDPLMINPGPTSGYLAERQTVAVFDTEKMEGKISEL